MSENNGPFQGFRRFALEAATIAALSIVIALLSNAIASRDRKLALRSDYPNALTVPQRAQSPIANRAATPLADDTDRVASSSSPGDSTPMDEPGSGADPPPAAAPSSDPAPATTHVAATPAAVRPARDDVIRRFPPTPDRAYEEISGDDAAWLYTGGALFLDARRSSVYGEGHIAGARSFPVWESDITDRVTSLLDEVDDQDAPIVVYCSGGACEDSHMLAEKLWGVFFTNVLVYRDGFPDWEARGGAVRSGSAP